MGVASLIFHLDLDLDLDVHYPLRCVFVCCPIFFVRNHRGSKHHRLARPCPVPYRL